jgi:hypothetical protein
VWFFNWFIILLRFYCPLGVKVGSFMTFHVLIVGLFFNLIWFGIKNIVRLIKFYLQVVFHLLLFPFRPSLPPSDLCLDFNIRPFERLPFGPSSTMIIHMYPYQLCFHVATSHILSLFLLLFLWPSGSFVF